MSLVVRFLKVIALTLFFGVALGYLAIRYILWPQLPEFKDQIAARLSQAVQQTVTIGAIQTSWDRFSPSARLMGITVGKDFAIGDLDATLSWRTFVSGGARLANLTLRNPVLHVERIGEQLLRVGGFEIDLSGAQQEPRALNLLLEQRRVEVIGGSLHLADTFAGQAPITLSDLGLVLENSGRSHKMSSQTKVTERIDGKVATVAEQLQLRGDFFRPVGSAKSSFHLWQGNAYADFTQLRWVNLLPHIQALAPAPLKPTLAQLVRANGNAKLWLTIQERPELFVAGEFTGLAIAPATATPAKQPLQLERATASAMIQLPPDWGNTDAAQSDVTVSQLQLDVKAANGLEFKTAKPVVVQFNRKTGALNTAMHLEPFKLEEATAVIAQLGVAPAILEAIKARAASGLASNTQLSWKQEGQSELAQWSLSTDLKDASSNPGKAAPNRLGLPGFRGLSANISATQAGGQLSVLGQRGQMTFPGLFDDETVSFNRLKGSLNWQQTKDKLIVNIAEIAFANDDGSGRVNGTYQTGGKGAGIVDLKGVFDTAVIGKIPRYIPKAIALPVRNWVSGAIQVGKVNQIDYTVKGDLYDFPYQSPALGQFLVVTKFQGVTLQYSPDWPALTDMTGELILDGPGLRFNMQQAKSAGVNLSRIEGTLNDYAQSELLIKGQGFGAAQNMVAFVNASPIMTTIDNFTAETKISGDARLDMSLRLPLKDLTQTKVDGTVTLSKSDVFVDSTIPSFGDVSGQLKFSDSGFSLTDMVGTFAGGPIKVNTVPNGKGSMTIRAEGRMDADGLRSFTNNPMTQQLAGAAQYKAVIEVQGKFSTVNIESDLVGLASTLPAPFSKLTETNMPLRIKTIPNPVKAQGDRPEGDIFEAKIGDNIAVLFDRRRHSKTQRMEIFRGSFGYRLEPTLPESGFSVAVNTDRLDVEPWLTILTAFAADKDGPNVNVSASAVTAEPEPVAGFARGFSLLPSLVTVVSSQVTAGSREFKNVVLGATRLEGFWRTNFSAQDISGYLTWRDAKPGQPMGTLVARFNRLTIPKARVLEVENLLNTGPKVLPGLDFSADEFIFDNVNFGKLNLLAENTGSSSLPIWSIQSLKLSHPSAVFSATGRWAPGQGELASATRATELDFKLDLADSGGFLDLIGVKKAVKNAPGALVGNVRWVGAPWGIDYPTLKGEIDLQLAKGQFLKVDAGAAKLISVLNLQSLPKRLTLDFSDLVDEGFAFDEVKGKAIIANGKLATDNIEINGPQARVSILGSADLATETQDLRIKVRPEINAGLASLAYVAVNPAIGLGTLVAQTIFRRPLQEAFAVEFDVRGSWVSPLVEQRQRVAIRPEPGDGSAN